MGTRGVHFYDSDTCNFLLWDEVFKFLGSFPKECDKDSFGDKLVETLANYDPDREFLAVHQHGTSVSVELYARPDMSDILGVKFPKRFEQ